ncbi:MAG TPA: polysaccharide deacetylase family protein, partial [Clostridia bacterium]|nr:polysaccharide deacetylase family protein [Clostridia bacterium]
MRTLNKILILATVVLALLMYPQTYIAIKVYSADALTLAKLSNFGGYDLAGKKRKDGQIDVVFMFDDGWKSVYTTAYPLFAKYGLRASLAIIPAKLSEHEYMSFNEVGELYMNGWDVLNHSYTHKENMDSKQLFNDFQLAADWMEKRFLYKGAKMAVVPFGFCDPYLIKLLIDAGYHSVRLSDNIIVLNTQKAYYYRVNVMILTCDVEIKEAQDKLYYSWRESVPFIFILHKIEQSSH